MPIEIVEAVRWAIGQGDVTPHELVERVRQWFNEHGVAYSTFSYYDLVPYLSN